MGCGDGSEGGAAGDGVGGARVGEFGVVQDVEVLDAELEVGFAVDGEGADDGAVPVGVSGATEGIL